MKTVFITGADRGIGFALVSRFMEGGWRVFAGQYMPEWTQLAELKAGHPQELSLIPLDVGNDESVKAAAKATAALTPHLDMLINCAGVSGRDGRDGTLRTLNTNSLGSIRTVEAFLPLMQEGEKRLCFVSSEAGCITLAHRTGGESYCVSKTCLNMAVRLMFEELQPHGYRFRLYHPGWVRTYMSGTKSTVGNFEAEETAEVAYRQFVSDRSWEDLLVMSDVSDEIWPY